MLKTLAQLNASWECRLFSSAQLLLLPKEASLSSSGLQELRNRNSDVPRRSIELRTYVWSTLTTRIVCRSRFQGRQKFMLEYETGHCWNQILDLITSLTSAFLTLSLFHRTFTETLHILGRERNRLLFSYIHILKIIVYKSCGELQGVPHLPENH